MDSRLQCQICKKTFTQKSSLIRHSKRCTPGPAPSLRQKSCRQCTASKTKCDLRRPSCGRCEQRNSPCEYIIPLTRGTRLSSPPADDGMLATSATNQTTGMLAPSSVTASVGIADMPLWDLSADISHATDPSLPAFLFTGVADTSMFNPMLEKDPLVGLPWSYPSNLDPLSTSSNAQSLDLLTRPTLMLDHQSSEDTSDNDEFASGSWLHRNSGPAPSTPALVKHSMETLLRVMKTWPKMLAKGFQTPPMFHFSQTNLATILRPMANCVAIAKMWAMQSDGTTEMVRQTLIQEMRSLFEMYQSLDERHLLSALQALVMYTIMIMFPGRGQVSVSLVDPAIFLCLQKVVSYTARTGLMLTQERDNERPTWESWVHVTAKRRAVFSLYLLHWSYSIYHGLDSFACSQLGFMPAPAPKFLWQAETREKWEELYHRWLGQWGDCPYMMREFAEIRAGTSLERRTEIWLEDADELGVLFFTIGSTVHPCVEWW